MIPKQETSRNTTPQPPTRINNVQTEATEADADNESTEGSSLSQDSYYGAAMQEFEEYQSHIGMARTITIVPHEERDGRIVNLSSVNCRAFTTTFRQPTLIFDTGADTCVIGKGWDILEETGNYANLVGFDLIILVRIIYL